MRSHAVLARSLRLARGFTSSAGSSAHARTKAKLSVDEYGTPHRRPLAPLGRDGHEEDRFSKVSHKEPPKRRARPKPAAAVLDPPTETSDELLEVAEPEAEVMSGALEVGIRRDLARYPDAILLTQVGSFYESYFDQAPLVARLLGIKLTSKPFGKGTARTRKAFAGFPLAQLVKHASALVGAGHKVVVVEEFKTEGNETYREVTRIITPGTGIDERFIKADEMSFVLALGALPNAAGGETIGMAYRDISTGASFTRQTSLSTLRDDILLVAPKEVVVDAELRESELGQRIWELLDGEKERESLMVSEASTRALPAVKDVSVESSAEQVLAAYFAATLLSTPPPPIKAKRVESDKIMQMDSTTLKSLEIRESLRGGIKGSLLSTVRRTSTPGGARLLAERLCAPSTVLAEINSRLSLVSAFHHLPATRRYLAALLKPLDDSARLLQRLYLHRGSPFDLLGLKRTLEGVVRVRRILEDCLEEEGGEDEKVAIRGLLSRLAHHAELAQAIETAIDEEALVERTLAEERRAELTETLGSTAADKEEEVVGGAAAKFTEGLWGKNEPWAVRPAFSSALTKLHEQLTALRRQADGLEKSLQLRYAQPKVSLRVVPKIGPVVHVSAKQGFAKIEADSTVTQVVKHASTRSYVFGEWTLLNSKIVKLVGSIGQLERETMKLLVARVIERYNSLQETAQVLSELDVALGFAELATEMGLVKPVIDDRTSLDIVAGRHPTVEHSLRLQGRAFTPNSVHFSHPSSFVHVLTGPNMAGKSTYLRQTALIVLLAQAGSFVPAESVSMGVVDRIFSRVGARDELDRDRSTFMVEMDEATSILKSATPRSLVLLDELGRGTSPLDGLAIAYAALEHLVHVNQSRTLFATHYHRLGELLGYDQTDARGKGEWEGIEFWCTDVDERENSVAYLHEIRRGLNDDSAGIIIARLSGMPQRAINVATDLRDRYR